MCFTQLPIRFDADGRATLAAGDAEPFRVPARPARTPPPPRRSRGARDFDVDPVTRVAGSLSFHTVVDLERRRVEEARSEASQFRGYEVILRGREPTDAVHISSRACGVCGAVHATCAAMAMEMAFGVVPPPLALTARNLGAAAELVYDHTLHLFLLAGPDYCERVVRSTTPSLWERALRAPAERSARHGIGTVAELMSALTPLTGALYREALQVTRAAREIVVLVFGKYPHPSTIFPGGIASEPTTELFNQVLGRIVALLDYAKKAAAVWDDLVEFLYAELPAYRHVGERPANLLCTGMWDDADAYDATYASCSSWGARRLSTPGAIVDGELRTTRLADVNIGIEEFVDRSYYAHWRGDRFERDPAGAPLSPYHPWNKETIPDPAPRSWREKYSWSTAPRWDRVAMESGPLARQWVAAVAGELQSEFIQPVAGGLEIDLPEGDAPHETLVWRIPPQVNALERNRARAYHIGYTGMVAYSNLLQAFRHIRRGETRMSAPYSVPAEGIGVGLWEAGRGTLLHYLVVEGGRIANYQIVTPSTWMASPEDPFGTPGPYEEAVLATPLVEEVDRPEDFTGIDILRTIRSFDPCMPCAVHLHSGAGRVVVRDATTCACGADG